METDNSLGKVSPRINHFDHHQYQFYVYVYLDPFAHVNLKYMVGQVPYHFAYAPIYIGKATGQGYRHNQHIAEYLKFGSEELGSIKIHNELKKKTFANLERNMIKYGNSSTHLPRNWEEYQRDWVIVLAGYDDQESLVQGEKLLIRSIGTVRKNTGPLVNAILG